MMEPKSCRWTVGLGAAVLTVTAIAGLAGVIAPVVPDWGEEPIDHEYLDGILTGDRWAWSFAFSIAFFAAFVAAFLASLGAIVIGVPLLLLTERRGWTSLRAYSGIGALVSAGLALIAVVLDETRVLWMTAMELALVILAILLSGVPAADRAEGVPR